MRLLILCDVEPRNIIFCEKTGNVDAELDHFSVAVKPRSTEEQLFVRLEFRLPENAEEQGSYDQAIAGVFVESEQLLPVVAVELHLCLVLL